MKRTIRLHQRLRSAVHAVACWIKKQINAYNSQADAITRCTLLSLFDKCCLKCLSSYASQVVIYGMLHSAIIKAQLVLCFSALLKLPDCKSLSKLWAQGSVCWLHLDESQNRKPQSNRSQKCSSLISVLTQIIFPFPLLPVVCASSKERALTASSLFMAFLRGTGYRDNLPKVVASIQQHTVWTSWLCLGIAALSPVDLLCECLQSSQVWVNATGIIGILPISTRA